MAASTAAIKLKRSIQSDLATVPKSFSLYFAVAAVGAIIMTIAEVATKLPPPPLPPAPLPISVPMPVSPMHLMPLKGTPVVIAPTRVTPVALDLRDFGKSLGSLTRVDDSSVFVPPASLSQLEAPEVLAVTLSQSPITPLEELLLDDEGLEAAANFAKLELDQQFIDLLNIKGHIRVWDAGGGALMMNRRH